MEFSFQDARNDEAYFRKVSRRAEILLESSSPKTAIYSTLITTYGLKQIAWGLFEKLVIADNLAVIVDKVFSDVHTYSGGPAAHIQNAKTTQTQHDEF